MGLNTKENLLKTKEKYINYSKIILLLVKEKYQRTTKEELIEKFRL